jgi:hypothetical protein
MESTEIDLDTLIGNGPLAIIKYDDATTHGK